MILVASDAEGPVLATEGELADNGDSPISGRLW